MVKLKTAGAVVIVALQQEMNPSERLSRAGKDTRWNKSGVSLVGGH